MKIMHARHSWRRVDDRLRHTRRTQWQQRRLLQAPACCSDLRAASKVIPAAC